MSSITRGVDVRTRRGRGGAEATRRLIAAFLSAWSVSALGQTISDLTPAGAGTYTMRIDGKPYVAVSRAQNDEVVRALQENATLKQRLAQAEKDLREYRSLTTSYEQLRKDYVLLLDKYRGLSDDSVKLGERYSAAAGKLVDLTKEYGGLVADYDVLARKYRDTALRSVPRQPLDLGVGVVRAGDENHVVAMAGAGTQFFNVGLRGWVFGGQGSYGVILGASF